MQDKYRITNPNDVTHVYFIIMGLRSAIWITLDYWIGFSLELFWQKVRARNKPYHANTFQRSCLDMGRRQVIHAIGQNQLAWTSQTVGQRSTLHLRVAGIGRRDALVVAVTNICSYPTQNAHSSTPRKASKSYLMRS